MATRKKRGASETRANGASPAVAVPGVTKAAASRTPPAFDAQVFLDSAGVARRIVKFRRAEAVYTQGDPAKHVFYIQDGGVQLSVISKAGKQAVVAILGPGEFFGERALAGHPVRLGTATALTPTTALAIDKDEMVRVLHAEHGLSDLFISHVLARNIRIEEDLIDQLFNSSEKRLARTLLLLARYGARAAPSRIRRCPGSPRTRSRR